MEPAHYQDLVERMLASNGEALTDHECAMLMTESDSRNDLVVFSQAAVLLGDEDGVVQRLCISPDTGLVERSLRALSAQNQGHLVWHVLFRLGERRPELLNVLMDALSTWPDRLRPMPNAWWDEHRGGASKPWHSLARNLGMQDEYIDIPYAQAIAEALRYITELDLGGAELDEEPREILFDTPALCGLKALSLARISTPYDDVEFFADIEGFSSLAWLSLVGNDMSAETAANLIVNERMPRLAFLSLAACNLDLVELARALHPTKPRKNAISVDFSQNENVSQGLVELAKCEALRGISGMDLFHVDVQPKAVQALANSPHAGSLRSFRINNHSLGPQGVCALLGAPWIPGVEDLDLFHQNAGESVASCLRNLSGGALQSLALMHNDLGPEVARTLGDINLGNLRTLRLSHNPLGDADLATILSNPSLGHLSVVEATGTGAGVATLRAICVSPSLKSLRQISLGDEVDDNAAKVLFDARNLPALRRIHLSGISDAMRQQLARAPSLKHCRVVNGFFHPW